MKRFLQKNPLRRVDYNKVRCAINLAKLEFGNFPQNTLIDHQTPFLFKIS